MADSALRPHSALRFARSEVLSAAYETSELVEPLSSGADLRSKVALSLQHVPPKL